MAMLEHVNLTVSDSRKTAELLCNLFDWKIRWQGSSMDGGGHTVHVGTDDHYLAVFSPNSGLQTSEISNYRQKGALNHVGVVVDDIAAMEKRVRAAGLTPGNHQDYEPGTRFYFFDDDQVEYEVVCYR